jgi:uncharacterized membrane protein YgdD (TMEM256/DUF423 family)
MNGFSSMLYCIICLLGMSGVAMGAVGKHWAEGFLDAARLKTLDTATFYHQIYSVFIFILELLRHIKNERKLIKLSTILCFTIGLFLFSGSLYIYIFFKIKWMVAITPLGGMLLIFSWGLLLFNFLSKKS